MTQDTVLYNAKDGIAVLTLNNPKQRNALSSPTLALLKSYLAQIADDSTIKVVVIRSEGPVFSSGHDLNELVGGDPEDYAGVFADCTEVMEAIRLLSKPVIAQVQGLATAAGCQLVATCDLSVAADNARFATPGVQIGLFCTTPGVAVARAVMPKKAMEMLLTGLPIPAQEALEFGLVNRGGASRGTGTGNHGVGSANLPGQFPHHFHWQAGLLPSSGNGPARCLRHGAAGHGGEPAGRRRQGRDNRFPGEAGAPLDRLSRFGLTVPAARRIPVIGPPDSPYPFTCFPLSTCRTPVIRK